MKRTPLRYHYRAILADLVTAYRALWRLQLLIGSFSFYRRGPGKLEVFPKGESKGYIIELPGNWEDDTPYHAS